MRRDGPEAGERQGPVEKNGLDAFTRKIRTLRRPWIRFDENGEAPLLEDRDDVGDGIVSETQRDPDICRPFNRFGMGWNQSGTSRSRSA